MNNNAFYLLILDSVRVPDAIQFCAQHEAEFSLLYSGTDWEPQLEHSPVCIMFERDDAVHQKWQTDHEWASSGIAFEYHSPASRSEAAGHLSRNITVTAEDGRLLLLRFYSPQTFAVVAGYHDNTALSYLLGNAVCAHFSPLLWETLNIKSAESSSEPCIEEYRFPTRLIEELLA